MKLKKWYRKWHKKQKIAFGLIIGALILASLLVIYQLNLFKFGADSGQAVTLSFSQTTDKVIESEFTVDVNLNPNGNNVCGVQSNINFTPSLVNVVSINISPADDNLIPLDPQKPFVFSFPRESFLNDQGIVRTSLSAPGCTTNNVLVYSVKFKAVGAGSSILSFDNVKVIGGSADNLTEISSINNSSSFAITLTPSATPSATPNVTPTPTPSNTPTPDIGGPGKKKTSTPSPNITVQPTPTTAEPTPTEVNVMTPEITPDNSTPEIPTIPTITSTPTPASTSALTSTPQTTTSFDQITPSPSNTTATKPNTGWNWKTIIIIIVASLFVAEVVIFLILRKRNQ